MGIPDSTPQLLILVTFILPGIVYQAMRSKLRGPTPDQLDASSKILRAAAVSTGLILVYAVLLGPQLVGTADPARWVSDHPRGAASLALSLLFVVPLIVAFVQHALVRWRDRPQWLRLSTFRSYDPTPTAWDFGFREPERCFVRVLTSDGQWVGGWFDRDSRASSFPHPRELYIGTQWKMGDDGSFVHEIDGSLGVYVRCDDARAVAFVAADDNVGTGGDTCAESP